jgi:hypothetical protein
VGEGPEMGLGSKDYLPVRHVERTVEASPTRPKGCVRTGIPRGRMVRNVLS